MNTKCAYKMIEDLLARYAHLPKQKSAGWYLARETSIGGSELSTVLGINKYKKFREFIFEKIGLGEPVDSNNPNFLWGNLFENVHANILTHIFNIKIEDFGSIPWRDEQSHFRVSPDGFFGASLQQMLSGPLIDNRAEFLAQLPPGTDLEKPRVFVLELKSPARRTIDKSAIPEVYQPQVFAELCIDDCVEFALFSECAFKRCSYSDYENTVNSTASFIVRGGDRSESLPLYMGIIHIYAPIDNSDLANYLHTRYIDHISHSLIDIGAITDPNLYFEFVSKIKPYNMICKYTMSGSDKVSTDNDDKIIDESRYTCVAVVPWKAYDISYHLVHKDPNYITARYPLILKTTDCITNSRAMLADDNNTEDEVIDYINSCEDELKLLRKDLSRKGII